jgi:hypothetical protein
MRGLDAWITGNYGEDHPDNVDDRSDRERHEAVCRAIDRDRRRRALNNGRCPECNAILTKQAYVDGACQVCRNDLGVW